MDYLEIWWNILIIKTLKIILDIIYITYIQHTKQIYKTQGHKKVNNYERGRNVSEHYKESKLTTPDRSMINFINHSVVKSR